MKVGTDAVLLGAWVNVDPAAKTILDIGSGSGVIALMMAQRSAFDTHVDAVEIDHASVEQAKENVLSSPWPDKIKVFSGSIQTFEADKKYDLIITNPPYFNKSLLPPAPARQSARHTETLSFDALIENVLRLLSPNGIFAVILPYSEGIHFRELAQSYQLNCHRSAAFYSRKGKPQERWLMEFSFDQRGKKTESLVLYEEGDRWTDQYANLTKDFYVRR